MRSDEIYKTHLKMCLLKDMIKKNLQIHTEKE